MIHAEVYPFPVILSGGFVVLQSRRSRSYKQMKMDRALAVFN